MIKALLLITVLAFATAQTDMSGAFFAPGDNTPGLYAQTDYYDLFDTDTSDGGVEPNSATPLFVYTGEAYSPSSSGQRHPVTQDDFNGQALTQYLLSVGIADVIQKAKDQDELTSRFFVKRIFDITYEDFATQPNADWDGDGGFVDSPGRIYRFEVELANNLDDESDTADSIFGAINAMFAVRFDAGYMGGGSPSVDYSYYQIVSPFA